MAMQKLPLHKGVYILPNLFTTGSMFAAFLGLLWASRGMFEACAAAVLISALLDGLDGKVARLTGSSSDFGVQFDSLADSMAFGITPGYMIFKWQLYQYDNVGVAVSFLFMVCCTLRLARFNVITSTSSKKFFIGLPTPAAGCSLAMLVLVAARLPDWILPALGPITLVTAFVLAFLMVSRVRYASFKEYGFLKAHPFRYMVAAILLFMLIVAEPRLMGCLVFLGYIIAGPIYTFFIMPRHNSLYPKKTPEA